MTSLANYGLFYGLGISFLIQIFFFTFAAIFKTDKVTDLSYGLTFIILAWFFLIKNGTFFTLQVIVTAMVTIWGLRLVLYLLIRILKIKKDSRFDGVRESFWKFFQFWFFQGMAVFLIMIPSILLLDFSKNINISGRTLIGIIIWLLGISIEGVADQQKFNFKNNPKNKGLWINSGIWKYSRHPNYFGEMLCWWGIFILVMPILAGWLWLSVIGPLFITFILLFVTGIPPLEKRYNQKYADNKHYQDYKRRTSLLIPLPLKK